MSINQGQIVCCQRTFTFEDVEAFAHPPGERGAHRLRPEVNYHLYVLERECLIIARREGVYRKFFVRPFAARAGSLAPPA